MSVNQVSSSPLFQMKDLHPWDPDEASLAYVWTWPLAQWSLNFAQRMRVIDHGLMVKGDGVDYLESVQDSFIDQPRAIDFRAFARTGLMHRKIYEENKVRPWILILDLSPSMFFGSKHFLKSAFASYVAILIAKLSYFHACPLQLLIQEGKFFYNLGVYQPDQISQFSQDIIQVYARFARKLDRPWSLWPQPLDQNSQYLWWVSDFYAQDWTSVLSCRQIAHLLHIYDPLEQFLPKAGKVHFRSGEGRLISWDSDHQVSIWEDNFKHKIQVWQDAGAQFPKAKFKSMTCAKDLWGQWSIEQ